MKRIGVLVVAYNAASTLAAVLDRIPRDFVDRIDRVLVHDDYSQDATYLVGLGYQQTTPELPLEVIRHPRNLGYGGNQKASYAWAMEHGLDIVVLLHGDGQYAPELLPEMVAPLERDEADAVFGSRMMEAGAARRGGMPMYKYVGNKILTGIENAAAGMDLSEWHSGYRAYSVEALRELPLEITSDGFDFDTQIILQLHEAGKRIVEIPIPTYYGGEICHVNGLKYAADVTHAALRYRAHKMGLGTGETAFATEHYEMKDSAATSHGRLLEILTRLPPSRILDLGCDDGSMGERLRLAGHEVTGVDLHKLEGVGDRLDRFVEFDLEFGVPPEVGGDYDVVLAADVLEHVRRPDLLLADIRSRLTPTGKVVTSVPNMGHWYPRVRVAAGRFDYDRRGILDSGHLRFFTRQSFERLVRAGGFEIRHRDAVGVPFEVSKRGVAAPAPASGLRRTVEAVESVAVGTWPTLFGYQLVYVLAPAAER
ncbi:MAG TPA: bifunctional glycosyltransferase/class I SAM-dependent methyltransferase [Acidimicrobiia bacterium]|nr:bifunctional glycosyltransferase/class I SAM-dependent methyltransferase [Acidimicrobiia bacterium]